MGMYTRMVFNAELSKGTPNSVIETLQWLVGDRTYPGDTSAAEWGFEGMLNTSSAYHRPSFTSHGLLKQEYGNWGLSVMCDIKNYWGQLEKFIEWITPYVEPHGWEKSFLGYTIYEEDEEPTLIYIHHDRENEEN